MPRLIPVPRTKWLQCAGKFADGEWVVRYEGREGRGADLLAAMAQAGAI